MGSDQKFSCQEQAPNKRFHTQQAVKVKIETILILHENQVFIYKFLKNI